jgi:SLT domain-containing protein
MPLALVWDLIAKDNASATFKRVGDSADHTAKRTDAVSDAFKHMGKAVAAASAVAVAAGIGAVLKTGLDEALDASKGTAQLAAGIKSTGNAANVSVKGMNALASSIQGYSGQTDDSIVKAEQLLLTFKNIRNQGPDKIFDQATLATANMAAKMGGDASGAAVKLGKALNDPAKGITALTKFGVSFTAAQKESIKAMVKSGDTMGAQKIILKELQSEFGGAAKAAGESLPGKLAIARRSFEDVSQAVAEGLIPVVLPALTSIGTTLSTKVIPAVTSFIEEFKSGEGAGGKFRDVMAKVTPALGGIAGLLTKAAIPAVQGFIQEFRDGEGPGGKFRDLLIQIYDSAIKPIADFITGTAAPAIKTFIQEFKDGTGPGGEFRDLLKDINDNAIAPLAAFITDTALPALKSIETWITEKGLPAIGDLTTWFKDNKTAMKALTTFITVTLLPIFLSMSVSATTSAAAQVLAWATVKKEAVTSSAAQVAAHYVIVGGWAKSAAAASGGVAASLGSLGLLIVGIAQLGPAWADEKRQAVDAWNQMKIGWKNLVDYIDTIDWIKALPTDKEVLGWMKSQGSALMDGFLSGLFIGWVPVKKWIGGIAGWIKEHKGPLALDAKLLTPHGEAIMNGFNDGLQKGFARTQANVSGMTGQLASWISAALAADGLPASWAGPMAVLVNRESGGNPNAINLTDSNARAGHPSQGLAQVIPGTFAAYRNPLLVNKITDPVANLAAALNYIKARYGSIFNVQQANANMPPRGYDHGGLLMPGFTAAYNASGKPERILTSAQTAKFDQLVDHGAGAGFPDTLVVVDSDGALIGRMKIEATKVVAGASRSARDVASRDGLRSLTMGT